MNTHLSDREDLDWVEILLQYEIYTMIDDDAYYQNVDELKPLLQIFIAIKKTRIYNFRISLAIK